MKYKTNSIKLVEKETGEIIDITKLTEDIVDITLDESVQRLLAIKELSTLASNSYRVIEAKFLQLMNKQSAKKYNNEDAIIKINPQAEYIYNMEKIDSLKKLLGEEQFNSVFVKEYNVNRTLLKGIRITGGEIKQIIDEMETRLDKKPSVVIAKK